MPGDRRADPEDVCEACHHETGVEFSDGGEWLCEDCLIDQEMEQIAKTAPRSPWQGFNR